jgi:hypothetical protein
MHEEMRDLGFLICHELDFNFEVRSSKINHVILNRIAMDCYHQLCVARLHPPQQTQPPLREVLQNLSNSSNRFHQVIPIA